MAAPLRTKVVLLGDGRVGKTSILLRYVKDVFDDRQASTLTASCFDRTVPLPGGESARVSIWDTAGQERFHALGPLYYRDADGALLVYDITDEGSFKRVRDWVAELKKMLGEDIVIAIAGNKADMEKSRAVKADEVSKYVATIGATHHLTSAKLGTGIADAFTELLKRIVAKKKAAGPAPRPGSAARPKLTIVDDEPKKASGGGCCGGAGAK